MNERNSDLRMNCRYAVAGSISKTADDDHVTPLPNVFFAMATCKSGKVEQRYLRVPLDELRHMRRKLAPLAQWH